jgi:hypothetical protein
MIVNFYGVWGLLKGLFGILWCLGILKRTIWDSSKDFMGFCGLWGTRILLHSECVKLFQPIDRM